MVQVELGSVSRQAVYDALATLTGQGVLRRIEPAGSPTRYEDRVGDNHHHLVCRDCGRMVDVDPAVGDAPCLTVADGSGYEIDEAEVIYWGRCPECVAATLASSDAEADARVSPAEQYSHGPSATNSRATSDQKESKAGPRPDAPTRVLTCPHRSPSTTSSSCAPTGCT